MTPVNHVYAFLLCIFSAWATIGALRYDHSETTGLTRIKLAALILTPLLFLILGPGIPLATVLLYYVAGFATVYLGLYSLAILLGTHRHSTQPTVDSREDRILEELQNGPDQRRQQRRQRTRQFQTQQRTQRPRQQQRHQGQPPAHPPQVFKDHK